MHHSSSSINRYLIISVILLLSSAAFYFLSLNLIGQFHIRRAEHEIQGARFNAAVEQFQKAAAYLPNDHSSNNSLGNIYYRMGSLAAESSEKLILFKKARQYFDKAMQLNPLDARSAYGYARSLVRLEQIYVLLSKKNMRHVQAIALPALEKAIQLRPASGVYRLAMARYLFLHNENERLLSEVRILGQLQPAMLNQLRREPFWSVAAREAFQLGVQKALAAGTTPRQSLFALSDIHGDEKKWQEAISFKVKGMDIQPSLNSARDYIRLGYLYFKTDELEQAVDTFFLALQYSENIEKDIITVLNTCRKTGDPQFLLVFYHEAVRKYGTSSLVDLSAARLLIDLQDLEKARSVLLEANSRRPVGEAYNLLARIAEKEQDWDEAELAIQKASMLDPQNSNYHLTFSRVLNRLQKYDRAEREAGLAIQYTDNASANLLHYRASLRMKTDDYEGALKDWLQAININPDNGSYYFQAGNVSEKMSGIEQARDYYLKAIELEPGNKAYIHRLERIVKKYGVKEE